MENKEIYTNLDMDVIAFEDIDIITNSLPDGPA